MSPSQDAPPPLSDKLLNALKTAGFDVRRKTMWDATAKEFNHTLEAVRAGVVLRTSWKMQGAQNKDARWSWQSHLVTEGGTTVEVLELVELYQMLDLPRGS